METNIQNSSTLMVRQENCLKIRDLDDLSELRKTLIGISYTLGVRDAPKESILSKMMDTIKAEFDFFTVEQLNKAINKALSGKLKVNGKVLEVEPYNNFSIPYVCKIFAAYREYLSNEGTLLPKVQEKSPELSDTEAARLRGKWLNNVALPLLEKYFKTGEYNIPDYGSSLYNYLDKRFIELSDKRWKEFQRKARRYLLIRLNSELDKSKSDRVKDMMVAIILRKPKTKSKIDTRAKKIGLEIFLTDCRIMNRDLVAEIKQHPE